MSDTYYSHVFDIKNSVGDFQNEELKKYIEACLIDIDMDDELNEWPIVEFKFGHHTLVSDGKISLKMGYKIVDYDFPDVVLRYKKVLQ